MTKKTRTRHDRIALLTLTAAFAVAIGCAPPKKDHSSTDGDGTQYLYVAAGACQGGANTTYTTATASNLVYRVRLDNGTRDMIVADYTGTTGESPVGIVDYDDNNLLVAVEKTTGRRVEKVSKTGSSRTNFNTDTGTGGLISNTLISLARAKDGGVFVNRTNAIGTMNSLGATQTASLVGTNPTGNCGTTNTKYSSMSVTNQGYIAYVNSEASDNRVGISKAGTTCMAGAALASTSALSTATAWIPEASQLMVATSGTTTTTDSQAIQVFDVTEDASTASLSSATKIYDYSQPSYGVSLYGISAMAYDSTNHFLYVASSTISASPLTNGSYVIEKLAYNSATKTLTRVGSTPWYPSGFDTKCISSMFIGK